MSGFRPRTPHPPPSQPPTVARISPMVPEVSLFVGPNRQREVGMNFNNSFLPQHTSANHQAMPQNFPQPPLHGFNNYSAGPLPQPPQPSSNQILDGLRKPTEFSRNFENLSLSDDSLVRPSSSGQQNQPPPGLPTSTSRNNQVKFVDYVQPLASFSPLGQNSCRHRADPVSPEVNKETVPFSMNSDSSPVPPDILKMLSWQNDQLKLLQEQVQALLQASPQQSPQMTSKAPEGEIQFGLKESKIRQESSTQMDSPVLSYGNNNRPQQQQQQQAEVLPPTAGRSVNEVSDLRRSVATNTSMLWPQIQNDLRKLTAMHKEEEEGGVEEEGEGEECDGPSLTDIRASAIRVNNSDNESGRSAINIDLPDYPASDCSPDLKRQSSGAASGRPNNYSTSWESPVLGESVSMYEAEQIQHVYDDILTKVNRLLATDAPDQPATVQQPPVYNQGENTRAPIEDLEEETRESKAVATCNRLRQLGVSFITPEDLERPATTALQSGPAGQQHQHEQHVSTLFLPRAACPSASVWNQLTSSTAASSPDTSLEISSLALKYLDEAQLSKLAATHHRNHGQHDNNNIGGGGGGKIEAATAVSKQQQQRDWQLHKKSSSSDVNMSLATQEFLNRYGLATPNTQLDAADNSSPKLKGGDGGGAVHRQRRPLTPLQNNNNAPPMFGAADVGGGAGSRQVFELRRELLKGKMTTTTTKENYPEHQHVGQQQQQVYRVQQQYQHLRYDPNVVDPSPSQPHPLAGSHEPAPAPRGEVKNRILDITAIKSQPKLL
eukprot:TRINITY_DN9486_c0_g1_i2.p1 TRINITY_DN9486_c0_g1~~TRINITY_DN9486_c0_g1_i2.p1  ORF type:complete len:776 (+),score=194.62 TRINITY_DN9486_c0_g1_i2:318-2645(+)